MIWRPLAIQSNFLPVNNLIIFFIIHFIKNMYNGKTCYIQLWLIQRLVSGALPLGLSLPWPRGYKHNNRTKKTEMLKNTVLAFKLSVVVFIILINVKMPTIVPTTALR